MAGTLIDIEVAETAGFTLYGANPRPAANLVALA